MRSLVLTTRTHSLASRCCGTSLGHISTSQPNGLVGTDHYRYFSGEIHCYRITTRPCNLSPRNSTPTRDSFFACRKYDRRRVFRNTIWQIQSLESSSTAMSSHLIEERIMSALNCSPQSFDTLYSETIVQYMALCAIYTCRLHEAVQ
jgi:hypothetical protein